MLMSWKDKGSAGIFSQNLSLTNARLRHVRIVRDYGMFDRREAPQFYPDAKGGKTVHA